MTGGAVFLDRDGTIVIDEDYPRFPERVALIPGALEALHGLRAKGYALYVVSNQSGVARGIISREQFESVHLRFVELLSSGGITLDGYAYCLHGPQDACTCRKPRTGLVSQAMGNTPLDSKACFVVGDKRSDLELADALGVRGCLVLTGYGKATEDELRRDNRLTRYIISADLKAMAEVVPPAGA